MELKPDYGLTEEDLVITDRITSRSSLYHEMSYLTNSSMQDDSTERILRHTVLLYNQPGSDDLLADCLHQAIVWEVG